MIEIGLPSFEDLLFVVKHLRADDVRELSVMRDMTQPTRLATDAWCAKYRRMAYLDQEPVLAFGATAFPWPGQFQAWAFGTDKSTRVVRAVTKYLKRTMVPQLLSEGVIAMQAIGHPENVLSARWLRHLGFTPRAITVPGIGAGKHDMVLWVTFADEHRYRYPAAA